MEKLRKAPPGHKSYIKFLLGVTMVTTVVIYSVLSNKISDLVEGHRGSSRGAASRHLLQEEEAECQEVHQFPDDEQCGFIQSTSSCEVEGLMGWLTQNISIDTLFFVILECREVHQYPSDEQCGFIQNTSSCEVDGLIDYNQFVYCEIGVPWGAMIILILWWLFWFVGLAVSADDFFCPSLVVISKTLGLSPNVAGVTFLAFGNGAPDLFSAIAALSGLDEDSAGLGVGGLLGAGMFVTTVVTGTISLIRPFKAMERPFLRDTLFYLGGVYWTFTCLWRGKMYLGEAIGYIAAYVFYVIVVVASGEIYRKQKEAAQAKESAIKNVDMSRATFKTIGDTNHIPSFNVLNEDGTPKKLKTSATEISIFNNMAYEHDSGTDFRRMTSIDEIAESAFENDEADPAVEFQLTEIEKKFDEQQKQSGIQRYNSDDSGIGNGSYLSSGEDDEEEKELGGPIKQFLSGINPINVEEWPDMGPIRKFYEIFKCPLIFCITLTCPVVNYEVQVTHNWNKYLQLFQCLFTPTFVVIVLGAYNSTIGDVFPVYGLTLIIGAALCLLVFFTSVDYEKPKYHWVFGYIGFFIAMVWIFSIANIIVTLLGTFGIVFNISDAILGLTLLAWGNSIGDWIADTVMARQGFARMGFSACFGAPFFNLMLGFGIPMLYTMGVYGRTDLDLRIDVVSLILCTFLMTGICCNILIAVISRFKIQRFYGIFFVTYYIIFLTTVLLAETGVIFSSWTQKMVEVY